MSKILRFILVLLFPSFLFAQVSNVIPNSSSVANASVADLDRWSAFVNPASIVSQTKPSLGFQYENRYLLTELSSKSLMIAYPTSLVDIGFSSSYFGYSLYNEVLVGLGFARNFADKFALGLQFNYQSAYFAPAGRYYGALFPQLGLSLRLSPTVRVGFSTFNPFQAVIKTDLSHKQLASVFSLGSSFQFSDHLSFRLQIDKELSSNYRFAGGIEYSMFGTLVFKLGAYDVGYLVPCIGLETNLKKMNISINTELHPLLGFVSSCSIALRFYKPSSM